MIVSRRFKTVFVKTRKAAGTSIELALSTICGPDDIITPVTRKDEALRRQVGGLGPQHFRKPWLRLTPKDLAVMTTRRQGRPRRFYNHMPATEAISYLGHDLWDVYFTFTIERNPWDKAVSRYYWESSRHAVPDFSTFLRQTPRHYLTCFDLYSHHGEVIVDEVVRFEELTSALERIWDRLGTRPATVPRAKGNHRPSRGDYRSMYSDEDAAFLADVCHREISTFGYSF